MGNKVYAVVDDKSGIVFAQLLVRHYEYIELGEIKVGARECWNTNPHVVFKIIKARLSSDQKDIDKIKHLDVDTFINDADCHQKGYDYLLQVNNPEAFERQFFPLN